MNASLYIFDFHCCRTAELAPMHLLSICCRMQVLVDVVLYLLLNVLNLKFLQPAFCVAAVAGWHVELVLYNSNLFCFSLSMSPVVCLCVHL